MWANADLPQFPDLGKLSPNPRFGKSLPTFCFWGNAPQFLLLRKRSPISRFGETLPNFPIWGSSPQFPDLENHSPISRFGETLPKSAIWGRQPQSPQLGLLGKSRPRSSCQRSASPADRYQTCQHNSVHGQIGQPCQPELFIITINIGTYRTGREHDAHGRRAINGIACNHLRLLWRPSEAIRSIVRVSQSSNRQRQPHNLSTHTRGSRRISSQAPLIVMTTNSTTSDGRIRQHHHHSGLH